MSEALERLQRRYRQDVALGAPKVYAADDLPLSYESITDEWLTDALVPPGSEAKIIGHQFGPPDNGSSERRLLRVEYDRAGADEHLRERFFCKASMCLESRVGLGMTGGAWSERTFYRFVRQHLDIEAPQGFYGNVDLDSLVSMVIIEDMSDRVEQFGHHTTKITRKRAEDQIDTLAKLHGAGYSNQQIRNQLHQFGTWPQYFERTLAFGLEEACKEGFRMAEAVIPASVFRREDEIWPKTLASLDRHRQGDNTYTHCDVHLRNWYVTKDDRMGLMDWQCSSSGHWSRDLAYCLSVGLDIDDRRAWERELIERYLDGLASHGGPTVAFEDAFADYRAQMMTVLAWWTITLNPAPSMPDELQPRDSTLCFLERIGTAMDDLDTLDAL